MTTIDFVNLSKKNKAYVFYKAQNRRTGISYYAFIFVREDNEDAPWEVHTYSTGLRQHCKYHFDTLAEAKAFVSEFLF